MFIKKKSERFESVLCMFDFSRCGMRKQPQHRCEEDLRGTSEDRHTAEEEEHRKDDDDVVHSSHFLHPLRRAEGIAYLLAVFDQEDGEDEAEEGEKC